MAKGFDFIGMVIEAPETQRSDMLAQMAGMTGTPVSDLEAELARRIEADKAKIEAAKRKAEAEARNAAIEAVTAKVEAIRDDIDALRSVHEEVTALEGSIVLSGFDGDIPTFTVFGLKPVRKGGGTGGGKPAATQPRPYVDTDGKRVVGSYNKWAEANVGLDTLQDLAVEHDIELEYSDKSGNLRSTNVEKLLLKAELIVASEVTAEEQAAFEASRES